MDVLGKTVWLADVLSCSSLNFPNRARATTSGQRSAAQKGQNSAPTNSTSGLPCAVRGAWPVTTAGGVRVVPDAVTPTVSKVEVGTEDRVASTAGEVTAGRAGAVGDDTWVRA